MKARYLLCLMIIGISASCSRPMEKNKVNVDEVFSGFETRFLDNYWKQYPCNSSIASSGPNSISVGYGKYYDELVIPDSMSFAGDVQFSKDWIDSLNKLDYQGLNDNNKISFNIIKNQLESDVWYQTVLNSQQWDRVFL